MFFFKRSRGVEWIIAFLGNPGPRYEGTRHNAGFLAGDEMARELGVSINRSRFKALTATADIDGVGVFLIKPMTYMNLSGDAIAPAADYYKVAPEKIIVVSDDTALDLGRLRVRRSGSAGGHNGLKSIIARLGTENFPRVKIGVGRPENPGHEMLDWVTGKPRNKDAELFAETAKSAAGAVKTYVLDGADAAMNKYNKGSSAN